MRVNQIILSQHTSALIEQIKKNNPSSPSNDFSLNNSLKRRIRVRYTIRSYVSHRTYRRSTTSTGGY